MSDQAEHLRQLMTGLQAEGSKFENRVIAVASGKGGVGKSNFCVNFALGLKQAGMSPIVIDADVGFANIEVLLGVRPTGTIVDVLSGTQIWDLIQESDSGLPFLSAGHGLVDLHSLAEHQVDQMLGEMKKLQERYNVILIDSGAGLGNNLGRMLTSADDLIVVTTPEPTSITDAYALLKMMKLRGDLPTTHLVINRVHSVASGREASEKLGMVCERFLDLRVKTLGYVFDDESVVQAVMRQQALLTSYPRSAAARCIRQLVENYLKMESTEPKRGMAGFIERMRMKLRPGGGIDSTFPA